jgi:C-terminal processing protease CtpA/Prc
MQFFLPAILLVPLLLAAQPAPTLSQHDRDLVLTMLRQVRDDVERHYYDRSFHGLDLKAQFAGAEQRVKVAPTLADAFSLVADVLFQLDDSHTVFIPPNLRTRVDYGWHMAMVGDLPLITSVDPASDAAAKGLAAGDRVLLLNAMSPSRSNLQRLAYFYRFIRPDAQQRVAVLKPDGAARTVDVRSRVENKRTAGVGDLFDELGQLVERARDRSAAVGDVLVWKMAVFGQPDAVDRMIARARGYRALVLDLRGNGGGSLQALRELVSRSVDHDVVIASETRRTGGRRETARPAGSRFDGRLIVLVDSRSASAAEMFARIVQIEKRGTVLGDRTAGEVMTARLFPHQVGKGWVAVYAASITVADVRMSDGGSLERIGVEPDELVLPRPSDLAAGRDPVLAHALEIAGGSVSPEEAGRLFK